MKSAEFTDLASAQAFLAAGRKKGERSTSDGWNTVLYDRGTHLDLELHGTPIVRYNTPSGVTDIMIPMRNHVVADRIQRYGLADKYLLNTTGGKWSLSVAWATLPGINEDPTIWYPTVSEVPAVLTLDALGVLVAPVPGLVPGVLGHSDRRTIIEPALKKWLGTAMKLLDSGWSFDSATWNVCQLCVGRSLGMVMQEPSLGSSAGSHNHLLSHILEGVVLPATVWHMAPAATLNPEIAPNGEGTMGAIGSAQHRYNREHARRYLKSAIRQALQ